MNLNRVLLIEDNSKVRQDVIGEFHAAGVDIIAVNDYPDLLTHLHELPSVQMVILDWLLDGENESDALLCLEIIRRTRFVPVIIWTEEKERFEAAEPEVTKRFPKACCHGLSKAEVNHHTLLKVLAEWHNQAASKLSELFRQSVAAAAEQTLFSLAEQSIDDLTKGLKTLIALGEKTDVDMEHATDVMLRILGRQLYADKRFVDQLKDIVADLKTTNPQATRQERRRASQMEALYMFYQPADDVVRNGDIVKISWNKNDTLAVVLTPACDLANPGKTSYVRLAMLNVQLKATDDRWPLTYHGEPHEVCFHEILVLRNMTTANPPKNGAAVMRYSHTFSTLNGADVSIRRECRLDEPYRADLLHNFISHAGRVGRPDFTG